MDETIGVAGNQEAPGTSVGLLEDAKDNHKGKLQGKERGKAKDGAAKEVHNGAE